MSTLQKSYLYKTYRNGIYLGNIPNVTSDFAYSQEINKAGATALIITAAIKVDRSGDAPNVLMSEDGFLLTAEDGTLLTAERQEDVIGDDNDKIQIREGNAIKVWEYSSYWPNGHLVYSGSIERVEASFGNQTQDEGVKFYVYPDSQDLNNTVIPGSNSLFVDQSQLNHTNDSIFETWIGQNFIIGAGITNISAIVLRVGVNPSDTITLSMLSGPLYDRQSFAVPVSVLATCVLTTSDTSADYVETQFTFNSPVSVTPGSMYSFIVTDPTPVPNAGNFALEIDDTAQSYSAGKTFAGVNRGGVLEWDAFGSTSIYFKTYSSALTTQRTFIAVDPTTIVSTILPYYNSTGGLVTAGTLQPTGLSVTYPFNLATILEGIEVAAKLAPASWFWYVDLGTNQLHFKQVSATADIKLIKGKHIDALKLISSTENVKNLVYFTGGLVGVTNLFKQYSDTISIQNNRVRLERQADNHIVNETAAKALSDSFLGSNKNKQYQTTVTVLDRTMDISILKVGMTVGFGGFGNFVDRLIIQIVRIDYTPNEAILTLGALPPRSTLDLQQVVNDINALQTIDNPTSPS